MIELYLEKNELKHEMELIDFSSIVFKHSLSIVLIISLSLTLTFLFISFFIRPTYYSEWTLAIDNLHETDLRDVYTKHVSLNKTMNRRINSSFGSIFTILGEKKFYE
jgi:capsular polysaccharide biosynthesis protein